MRVLIAEDDFTCRTLMKKILEPYATCDIAINGVEALEAVRAARDGGEPYDLICLDIMMPEMNGQEVLEHIRRDESEMGVGLLDGVKVIITSALDDTENIIGAFRTGCEAYLTKPIARETLVSQIQQLGIL